MSRLLSAALLGALLALAAPQAAQAQASPSPFTSGARYDIHRRVTGTIAPDPDGAGALHHAAVRNSYDVYGRLTKVETGELAAWQAEGVLPSAWPNFTVFRIVETLYDPMDRKVRDTVREGATNIIRSVTQYSYDPVGRPDCTAVRMNPADFASPPLSACAQGTGGTDRIARNFYDVAGQLVQVREGVGVTALEAAGATFSYTPNGHREYLIDGEGSRAQLVYDGHGRQTGWVFPSTTRPTAYSDTTQATALATAGSLSALDHEEHIYDPNGNRIGRRKRDGRIICWHYDSINRVMAKFYLPSTSALDLCRTSSPSGADAVYYGYNARGQQTYARFASTSGQGITNAWNPYGEMISSSTNMGGTTRTLAYQYDDNGNRVRITHPDAHYFRTDYDGLDRPVSLLANGVTAMQGYAYYAHGGVAGSSRANGTTSQWGYDGVRRLSAVLHGLAGTANDVSFYYGYNSASQMSSVWRDNDSYAWGRHYAVQRAFTTDGLNRYTQAVSALGTATYGYDANGNMTSDGTSTYTYDVENRLITRSGGVALSYDPLGRLFQVTGPGTNTNFLYDGDALVAEYNSAGNMTRRYVHNVGADVPLLSYDGATLSLPYYLHADHQGSIVAISDPWGVGAVNSYDEYGIPAVANTGRFQYTGQIWIPEIGMYHYKARVYSPTLGRFLQTDPIGYDDQYNLYAYVGNDPVNGSDPSGTFGLFDNCPAGSRCTSSNADASNAATGGAVGGAARGAFVLIRSDQVRRQYESRTARLPRSATAERSALKEATRSRTPREIRTIIERRRPNLGPPPGSGGTANRTNARVNSTARTFGTVGRGLLVFGVGVAIYDVATSDNRLRATFGNVGALGGGLIGGAGGAAGGAALGGPVAPVTGVVGGVSGAIAGGYVGYDAGTQAYDLLFGD